MQEVINIRSAPANWKTNPQYVYIGRAGKGMSGKYGNPISRGKRCPVCGEVHEKSGSTLPCYKKWLWNHHLQETQLIKDIRRLKDKTLVCFCKPKPCHGDIIVQYLNWLQQRRRDNDEVIWTSQQERTS